MSLRDDAAYLRSIGLYIGLSILLFASTGIMGYFAAGSNPELTEAQLEQIKEIFKMLLGLPPLSIMIAIFINNLLKCIMASLLGLGFGLLPFIIITFNGYILGIIAYIIMKQKGVLFLIAGILPHGIIELPTILICSGIGFRLGYLLTLSLYGRKTDLAGETKMALHLIIRWVLPLIFLAALVETFITPLVVSVIE